MAFLTQKIGVTGPRGRIGSGDEYHIDSKFGRHLTMEQIRDRFDALASQYQQDGRIIEFSNPNVAGLTYDLNASPEERLALLQKASAAHNHSVHKDFHSFDYYAPTIGNNRYHKSAEGAPVYLVGAAGLSTKGDSGGGYGNFGYVLDANGNVVSKTGHADNAHAVFGGGILGGEQFKRGTPGEGVSSNVQYAYLSDDEGNKATPEIVAARERAQNYSALSTKEAINAEYDRVRREDPENALAIGLQMHRDYFNK